ncbi:MAG: enoyl-CoA hydratase [Rhodospirillaceae bacterium]|nr:enoyl-CoA hydratase [Rhodospirillaceae bacterium]MBT7731261.1 enoyl-CoA hydratase [Rhodospirillaceae bacterium]
MELSTKKILAENDGSVGRIILNNPDRRNAISLDMWQGIGEAFDQFSKNPDIRCVVMSGAGDKAFASGADISQFKERRSNAEAAEEYAKISMSGRQKMLSFDKPFIAQIQGFCMGGGLGIALTADIRIASDDAQFGVPAARLSIAYDRLNLNNLVALVGPSKAKEILITAKRYSGTEAERMGLVNACVPVSKLEIAISDITDRIAENAPLSMKASKLTINELMKDDTAYNSAMVEELTRDCFDSSDYQEGQEAFLNKRKPIFKGL